MSKVYECNASFNQEFLDSRRVRKCKRKFYFSLFGNFLVIVVVMILRNIGSDFIHSTVWFSLILQRELLASRDSGQSLSITRHHA